MTAVWARTRPFGAASRAVHPERRGASSSTRRSVPIPTLDLLAIRCMPFPGFAQLADGRDLACIRYLDAPPKL
jgi:hypothetical protein